jgi:hypothetical protein
MIYVNEDMYKDCKNTEYKTRWNGGRFIFKKRWDDYDNLQEYEYNEALKVFL